MLGSLVGATLENCGDTLVHISLLTSKQYRISRKVFHEYIGVTAGLDCMDCSRVIWAENDQPAEMGMNLDCHEVYFC